MSVDDSGLLARRTEDKEGIRQITCWVALRLSEAWDFIDKRDIDKHLASWLILTGTWKLTAWAMAFAASSKLPGIETAAVIAAATGPFAALQAAALAFYFKARG